MKIENVVLFSIVFFIEDIFSHNILSKFHQTDYKIRNTRVEILYYNKDLLNFFEIKTFKFNRTTTAYNGTANLKVDMSIELEMVVQANKFYSNEYRHFPIRVRLSICKMYNANVVGVSARFRLCGNITSCFGAKGKTYHICNFTPDIDQLPPNIPTGEYRLDCEIYYLNISLIRGYVYGEVYRPIYPKY